MPVLIKCPSCETQLSAAEDKRGKKIRCPRCQELFQVPLRTSAAKKPRRRDDDDDDETVRPAPARESRRADDDDDETAVAERPLGSRSPRDEDRDLPSRSRPARRRHDNDDDYDEEPKTRRRQQERSALPWILAGSGAGVLALVGAVVAVVLGFKNAANGPAANVHAAATPAPPAKSAGPPVTEAEAKQFAAALTQGVNAGDGAAVDRLLHLKDLLERLVSDLGLTAAERQACLRALDTTFRENELGKRIIQAAADGGSYRLLRVHTVAGRQRLMFRLVTAQGAINYHDCTLVRFPDGIGMEDVYIFLTGEPLSQTMRGMVVPGLMQLRKGGPIPGQDVDYVKNMPTIEAMSQAIKQGRFADATGHYRRLPLKLQEHKTVLVLFMQGLMQQGEAAAADYLAAVEKFRKHYPDDPAVDFISIDFYVLRKQYDSALAAVDRLEKSVGGDTYLGVPRSRVLANANRFKEARAAAESAIKAEPTIEAGYWARVDVSLRERAPIRCSG